MEHQGSFLTGFLTGQRLKTRLAGLGGASDGGANPVSFSQWAANAGAAETLSDPDAYTRFVNSLLFPEIADGRKLIWRPTFDDIVSEHGVAIWVGSSYGGSAGAYRSYLHYDSMNPENNWTLELPNCSCYPRADRRSWHFLWHSTASIALGICSFQYRAPVSGGFSAVNDAVYGVTNATDGTETPLRIPYGSTPQARYIGQTYAVGNGPLSGQGSYQYNSLPGLAARPGGVSASCVIELPVFSIAPYAAGDDAYSASLRPGTLPGSPVSETARTFTNPITGEILHFDSFTYDYTTRTYSLTLPDDTSDPENPVPGGTMTVTFGNDFLSFTTPDGEEQQAMYLDNGGVPITAPAGAFHKAAFLSGLAAGMAADGW